MPNESWRVPDRQAPSRPLQSVHHPQIPKQIPMSRKNLEDLITAFVRQKYKAFGIENYSITFKWTDFIDDVQVQIKRK